MVIMRFALTYWRKHNIPGNIIWTGSGVAFPGVLRTTYIYPVVKMAMMKMAEVFDLSVRSPAYSGPKIRMNVVAPGIVYIEKRGATLEEATKAYGGPERLKRGGGWTPINVLLDAWVSYPGAKLRLPLVFDPVVFDIADTDVGSIRNPHLFLATRSSWKTKKSRARLCLSPAKGDWSGNTRPTRGTRCLNSRLIRTPSCRFGRGGGVEGWNWMGFVERW